jgi:hypothetical protein
LGAESRPSIAAGSIDPSARDRTDHAVRDLADPQVVRNIEIAGGIYGHGRWRAAELSGDGGAAISTEAGSPVSGYPRQDPGFGVDPENSGV